MTDGGRYENRERSILYRFVTGGAQSQRTARAPGSGRGDEFSERRLIVQMTCEQMDITYAGAWSRSRHREAAALVGVVEWRAARVANKAHGSERLHAQQASEQITKTVVLYGIRV
jgi:hypothetical protein